MNQSHSYNHLSEYPYRLFAAPSFIEGLSRLVDFHVTLNVYNEDPTDEIADLKAMRSDWQAVGLDMANAIHTYERLSSQESSAFPRA